MATFQPLSWRLKQPASEGVVLTEAGFCARYADDYPPDCLDAPLTEQARNRDHDSSDEREQARKQHNVTQECTHTRASPSSPLCGAVLASQWRPRARRPSLSTCGDCSTEFQGRPSVPGAIWSYFIACARIDNSASVQRRRPTGSYGEQSSCEVPPRSGLLPKECWRGGAVPLFQATATKYRFCSCFLRQ